MSLPEGKRSHAQEKQEEVLWKADIQDLSADQHRW